MPVITERSTQPPLLHFDRISHGTLSCANLAKTRAFYEEVLGLDVIQTSPVSMTVRLGTHHVYAVVETGQVCEMPMLNHNGLDVKTKEDVDNVYENLLAVKEKYGIQVIRKPGIAHADYAMFFCDLDGNWWEVVAHKRGIWHDFDDPDLDMTGKHAMLHARGARAHMHDENFRNSVNSATQEPSE